MIYSRGNFAAFLLIAGSLLIGVSGECSDVSYSEWEVSFQALKRITRIAIGGQISAFYLENSLDEKEFQNVMQPSGDKMVVYSTLSHVPSWTHVDLLSSHLRITPVFEKTERTKNGVLMLTVCDYETPIMSFSDSPFHVDIVKAGLVSMYENELTVLFRTFRSGLFFFSVADQGDVLIAQITHGTVHVVFDFGSLAQSRISGGRALDDGSWHEMRWIHQFDSVQLSIDGVLINQTTPTGLYRKLDLHSQIHVAGRPPDDFSPGIESTFSGCMARVQLNSVDLLQYAPKDQSNKCQMPRPPSLTLKTGAKALIPFSFLPFSFEFRTLPLPGVLVHLLDAENGTLLQASLEDSHTLCLISNITKFKQISHPAINVADGGWHSFSLRIRGPRLEVDVDGYTVLWLEGAEVRRISVHLATIVLSATGCYRSATIDFDHISTEGNVSRGVCEMKDRCLPNPCENGGFCAQTSLSDYSCKCGNGYSGKNCHTSEHYRSCEEWFYFKDKKSKKIDVKRDMKLRNVTLDVDGGGSRLRPFSVQCKREMDESGDYTVTTVVQHDLQTNLIVTGEHKPGAVRHSLDYGIKSEEMDLLVEGFDTCQQFMSYGCRGGARLMTFGDERTPSSWYATRSDKHGLQWGEAPPYSRMCSCAVNSTCTHNRMCNCDSGEDGNDSGWNPYPQLLPVTTLFLGGTTISSALNVSIGPLICKRKVVFEPVTFISRDARLTGTKSFTSRSFDLLLHVKFTHPALTIFTWESADGLHWFHLYINDGRILAEIVNGGESVEIATKETFNDGEWHAVYWEADNEGMRLSVDSHTQQKAIHFVLPNTFQWTIGSRHNRGNTGFAGVLRNVYLCGEELPLSNSVKRDHGAGVKVGESGVCVPGVCKNDGKCIDRFDSFQCDCSLTPFGGPDCSKEYGMWVPLNSTLSIPWQNPAHQAHCHRIALQTLQSNVSLLRAKAMFSDAKFNLTMDEEGYLSIRAWDGFFFSHRSQERTVKLNDDVMHDVEFCATRKKFTLNIDEVPAVTLDGNWTFFESLNVWDILDKNFTGCVTRLHVGNSFPLKNVKSSRLKYTGKIKFGTCPSNTLEEKFEEVTSAPFDEISIHSVVNSRATIISITSIGGLCIAGFLVLLLSVLICYMRSRPEGVYKTNEGRTEQYSPSLSEEPLVHSLMTTSQNKEYFC